MERRENDKRVEETAKDEGQESQRHKAGNSNKANNSTETDGSDEAGSSIGTTTKALN